MPAEKKIVKKPVTEKPAASGRPEVGSPAPAFSLPSTDGSTISLKDFAGKKNVVLYFYPRDMTPGCTTESCDFRDRWEGLGKLDTVVLGVSTDDVASHVKFTQKHALTFPLLADVDHKLADAYGVWVEKNMYGKKSMGLQRSTFVIDKKGIVRKVWGKVSVVGHAEAVLEFVRENLK